MTPEQKDKMRCKARYRQSMRVLDTMAEHIGTSRLPDGSLDMSQFRPVGAAISTKKIGRPFAKNYGGVSSFSQRYLDPLQGPVAFGIKHNVFSRDHELHKNSRDYQPGVDNYHIARQIFHPKIIMHGLEFACFESVGIQKYIAIRPDAFMKPGHTFSNVLMNGDAYVIRSKLDSYCSHLWDSTDALLEAIKYNDAFIG